jgi:hypothetical protein
VRPFVSPPIVRLPHCPARAGSRRWLVRWHSQLREAIAEPAAFEETLQPAATLRLGHDE